VLNAKPKSAVLEQDWATLVEAIAAGDQLALHVVGSGPRAPVEIAAVSDTIAAPELLRPLLEYERLVGGRW
jgi:hypothetical protein